MPCPDCATPAEPLMAPADNVPVDGVHSDGVLPVDAAVPPAVTASVAIHHRDTRHLGQRGRRR